jgi:hypothetical protein
MQDEFSFLRRSFPNIGRSINSTDAGRGGVYSLVGIVYAGRESSCNRSSDTSPKILNALGSTVIRSFFSLSTLVKELGGNNV